MNKAEIANVIRDMSIDLEGIVEEDQKQRLVQEMRAFADRIENEKEGVPPWEQPKLTPEPGTYIHGEER